ncbi:HD domain protein [Planctomycetes bacterium MalM25]|nr:HD domain protein [Planctomycetes bacterium MalM25]
MSDKVFRDPLYNYIAFDRGRDGWLIDLIDCPEVQRLRRIHQLGVSNFTYPGADHTRFAHSLGVTHLMKLVLEHLERSNDAEKIKNARQALLATALLHDVGHGPFSHLFEPCLGIKHEHWSIAVVRDESSAVHKVLKREGAYLPDHVADLIDAGNTKHPSWQRALMSSQLDVDRLDYLRRDSLFTGAGYGHFDWHRLLTTVQYDDAGRDLVWPEKSALAIEEYIFARYYM